MRQGGQIRQHSRDGVLRRFQNATVGVVATRPQNAVYLAVAFIGSAPDIDRERTCSWIAVQNYLLLTQGASKIENNLYRLDSKTMVCAGCSRRTGKKMSFLWSIHSSLATKNSSTRPQQVLRLVPRVW
ncbi:hypothetical protein Taro_002453 [Colocasia esculenta]|uniref:Uncharacterized protein n=1 Tax=Colocasia esculenta TaxID=4460 RepID=A0A843TNQ2_COLES|nr:hypothetical protein [Colocasia esculenta]